MGPDYSLHVQCRSRIWFCWDIRKGSGSQKLVFVLWYGFSRKPVLAFEIVLALPKLASLCRTSLPFSPPSCWMYKKQMCMVAVLSSIHWKNAIEASQRAQRTSKATLNPKLYFPHGSTQENKQGLDASVSKSLFTLRWWRALKRVLLCSVIGLRAKEEWPQEERCSYRPGFWCFW